MQGGGGGEHLGKREEVISEDFALKKKDFSLTHSGLL